jgi:hypothetical protein
MAGFSGGVMMTAFPDLSGCFLKKRPALRGLLSKRQGQIAHRILLS